MAVQEVRVCEVGEVLRLWLAGEGIRAVERLSQVDRKTVAAMSRRRDRSVWSMAAVTTS